MPVGTVVPLSSNARKTKVNGERSAEMGAGALMVRQAKEQGLALTGPGGLLKLFTKNVLETALNEEMVERLGREKHVKNPDGRASNARNGTSAKMVLTDTLGPVQIEVSRGREGTFSPVIAKVRDRQVANRAFYATIGSTSSPYVVPRARAQR